MSKKRKTKNSEIKNYDKINYSNLNFGTYDVDSCSVDWFGVFSVKNRNILNKIINYYREKCLKFIKLLD